MKSIVVQTVHRDIKPHNILLTNDPVNGGLKAVISDFGISRKLPPDRNSMTTNKKGTEGWIAPEAYHRKKLVQHIVMVIGYDSYRHYLLIYSQWAV